MNYFTRLIVIFIAIYMILFKPLQYASEIHTITTKDKAGQLAREFIDSICFNKELTTIEYETFLHKLSRIDSSFVFKVSLSIGEFIEESIGNYSYDYAKNNIKINNVEINNIEINNFKNNNNESIINNDDELELSILALDTAHEHSDICYFGTAHEHIGSHASGGACYETKISHSHSSSCYRQKVCGRYASNRTIVYYDVIFGKCPQCGKGENTGTAINVSDPSHSYYCSYCKKTVTSTNVSQKKTHYVSKCNGCESTVTSPTDYITSEHNVTDYNSLICKKSTGTYYELTCKIKEGYYHNGVEETYDPKCGKVVMSIKPVYNDQYVEYGKAMNSGGIVTFLNGNQSIIELKNNYVKKMGQQNVTLTYQGLLYSAKDKGTLTCTTIVKTVKYYNCLECGSHYESNPAGNDPGCPICRQKLLRIKIKPIKTVYNRGEVLDIDVTAVYRDREVKVNGWTSNYNAYITGEQEITVTYLTESAKTTIYVRSGSETICPDCKLTYDKDENIVCPNCSIELMRITAYTEKSEILLGEDIPVYVIAEYKDGHFEYLQDGFEISGFNKFIPGIQLVAIRFKGYTDTVLIQVIDNSGKIKICENKHNYLIKFNGADTGCPYCSLMEDECLRYLDMSYDEKIINKLYEYEKIVFKSGEYISIEVKSYKASADIKDSFTYKDTDGGKLICVYGGKIR